MDGEDIGERLQARSGGEVHPAPGELRRRAERVALARRGNRAVGTRAEPIEGGDGLAAADAVGRDGRVALEFLQGALGVGAVNAVFLAGIETERVQAPLQLGDVVAAQHRAPHAEEAVTQPVAAVGDRRPRFRTAHAIHANTASSLKAANG